MGVSPEFLAASRRAKQILKELLEIRQKRLVTALQGPNVLDVVIEPTIATLKVKSVKIVLKGGREITLRARTIDDILVQERPENSHVLELEHEYAQLNKKWHLYP